MKLCVISDTWGKMPLIDGKFDIFIHCGNFLPRYKNETISWSVVLQEEFVYKEFNPWLDSIDATHKIVIPGHTDYAAQFRMRDFDYHLNAIFLVNEAVTLNGNVYYGMPFVSGKIMEGEKEPGVFVCQGHKRFVAAVNGIENKTNVLITRAPPLRMMDIMDGKVVGSKALSSKIKKLKNLAIHVFGMATDSAGGNLSYNKICYINACSSIEHPYRMIEVH